MRISLTSAFTFAFGVSGCGVTVGADTIDGSYLRSLARKKLFTDRSQEPSDTFPASFSLPDGFRPEGIAAGTGQDVYVTSTAGPQSGSIWKGDISTGQGGILVEPTGNPTRGVFMDNKGRLWVARLYGARVYDSVTGDLLKQYDFVTGTGDDLSVINDVIVTNQAVVFTDSGSTIPDAQGRPDRVGKPRLFVIDLSSTSSDDLPDTFTEVTPDTQAALDTGFPTFNGIETVPGDSSKVVVCHTFDGKLYLVDLFTGVTTEVDVGVDTTPGPFTTCDGLRRRGKTLYVLRNRDTKLSVVTLAEGGASGTIDQVYNLKELITSDPVLDTPTTLALFGSDLYMPDSRFRLACPGCNEAPFEVYRISAP